MVERMAGDFDKAQALFEEELALLKNRNPNFYVGFAANYYEQGYILLKKNRLMDAEERMNQSLQYSEQSADPVCLGCSLRGLGEIFKAKGEIELSEKWFQQSIGAFQKADDIVAVNEVYRMLEN